MPGMAEAGRGSAGKFALIRHSAYALGGDPAFEEAVETREITDREAHLVRASGAVVYPLRAAADAAGLAANAAADAAARGCFSSLRIAGAEFHVPRTT